MWLLDKGWTGNPGDVVGVNTEAEGAARTISVTCCQGHLQNYASFFRVYGTLQVLGILLMCLGVMNRDSIFPLVTGIVAAKRNLDCMTTLKKNQR